MAAAEMAAKQIACCGGGMLKFVKETPAKLSNLAPSR